MALVCHSEYRSLVPFSRYLTMKNIEITLKNILTLKSMLGVHRIQTVIFEKALGLGHVG